MGAEWTVGIDIGGTFTDVVAVSSVSEEMRTLKVPSRPDDPAAGFVAGLQALADDAGVAVADIGLIIHGTTLATNAIIDQRRLARTALITTAGFGDVLAIGRHWRTELYDIGIEPRTAQVPAPLRFELTERCSAQGDELVPLDREQLATIIERLRESDVEAVAVAFLHSYRNPEHEREVVALLRDQGRWAACASAELSREVREYERTSTTVLNAALMPLIDGYLERLEERLHGLNEDLILLVTQSNGGALTPAGARARPASLALSGPAGGVVATVEISKRLDLPNVIALDMGGTSADISIISGHEARIVTQLDVGDIPVRLPSVEVRSIGAGGGSLAAVNEAGQLSVGPASAGADPGPACYARGGTLPTVTDCQLVLGRLSAEHPLAGRLAPDIELASAVIQEEVAAKLDMTVEEAAAGIVEVANAAMERAIRVALQKRGDDARDFALIAFGGAGPLHAIELASSLGIDTVVVPPHPGTLSAIGLLSASPRLDFALSRLHRADEPGLVAGVAQAYGELEQSALTGFADYLGDQSAAPSIRRSCDIRYAGQAHELTVALADGPVDEAAVADMLEAFHVDHERSYGFANRDDLCELVTFRAFVSADTRAPASRYQPRADGSGGHGVRVVHELGRGPQDAQIYDRADLAVGDRVSGPAVIHQVDATTFLPDSATGRLMETGDLVVSLGAATR